MRRLVAAGRVVRKAVVVGKRATERPQRRQQPDLFLVGELSDSGVEATTGSLRAPEGASDVRWRLASFTVVPT